MRLAALQSVVNAVSAGSSGYPRPPVVPVSRAPCGTTSCVVPRALASRVHPLLSLASSSEYVRLEPAPRTDASSAFLGVPRPHRGISCGDPLAVGVPPPAYGPSSAFRTPSTVFALHDLVGLFHPTTTSGIHLPGVFPATQPVRLSTTRALLSLATDSCPGLPHDSSVDALAFRALIQAAIRDSDAAV